LIKSFRNEATRRLYEQANARSFRGLDLALALERLDILDAAHSFAEIPPLRSVGLHALKGKRAGQWAISVNARWRICFEIKRGDVYNVEVTDYHEG
jgi:proteic killer suppression protein